MFASSSDINDSIFTLEYADSVPQLSKASSQGDLENIKKFISRGSLPQTPDNRGWTSIHCCVAAGQIKALKLILKLKSKSKKHLVNLTTWENVTPLLLALKASPPSLQMVRTLLEAGASPNISTHTKLFPLHLACLRKGNIDFVKLLVHFGADVNVQEDLSLFTPLHFAVCQAQDMEIVKFLIKMSDLNLENVYERTAFLEACNTNFLNMVQLFIEKDRKFACIKGAIPPLVYAGAWGNFEMTQLLINSGADVNHRCKALVTCNSELLLLDMAKFLPIHSSLKNIKVFNLFLKSTKPTEILSTDTNFCNFPLFVIVYTSDVAFIETLLQSDLPDKLKSVCCGILTKFILSYPDMLDVVIKKFPLFFKYNFHLEPENVFQSFVCHMSTEEQLTNIKLLHLLAQMGISSADQFLNKNSLIEFLSQQEGGGMLASTSELLSQSVLSLKQLCRIVVRHYLRTLVKSDWLALKLIRDSGLPDCLKEFLFFEKLR